MLISTERIILKMAEEPPTNKPEYIMIERIKYGKQLELDHTVGGNKNNVVNPRNTFDPNDKGKAGTPDQRWKVGNHVWRNEV